jgi:hypothetical protein
MVRNQPSQVSVTLPNPGDMRDADIENHVQKNKLDYGPASFSGKVDFPLVKTAMYAADTDDPKDPGIAEDSPHLVQDKRIYLGYALVKPWTEDSPNLELDVHTDAGVLSLSVPMKQTVDVKEGESVVDTKEVTIQAGYIYHIDVNFNIPDSASESKMELYGTDGYIICKGTLGQEEVGTLQYLYAPQGDYSAMQTRAGAKPRKFKAQGNNIYQKQIEDFNGVLRKGKPSYKYAERAVQVQKIVDTLYREG